MNLERELSASCAVHGYRGGYFANVGDEIRIHREGEVPAVGREAVFSYLGKHSSTPTWSPVAGDVSTAGDLGCTYGSYECKTDSMVVESGYYLHVWKRNAAGKWILVADVSNPLPPKQRK